MRCFELHQPLFTLYFHKYFGTSATRRTAKSIKRLQQVAGILGSQYLFRFLSQKVKIDDFIGDTLTPNEVILPDGLVPLK